MENNKINHQDSPPKISLILALTPLIILIIMLIYNVLFAFGDDALGGSNQFILLLGAGVAIIVGTFKRVPYNVMINTIAENIKSTTGAILILLLVGSLAGTWMISGIIPTMIYYGLQVLHPTIFLLSCVIICSIVSIFTGSSWTTTATVGIALMGIAKTFNIPLPMTAGAVLSGAYFGDKMSPLSDTTNLAPAMAGTDLYTHIKYMMYTTFPTILITMIFFLIAGFSFDVHATGKTDISSELSAIDSTFNINPWLFTVPLLVVVLIARKVPPLISLMLGALAGGVAALIFQPEIVSAIATEGKEPLQQLNFNLAYKGVMMALFGNVTVITPSQDLNELFQTSGMAGMLNTVWLIICAMAFGGVMEAIGALNKISATLLRFSKSVFGIIASTVASCITVNITSSDQYLAIVIPGRMFAKAYEDKKLAPENLSRTLEDSGTATSALVPWNTCGAYQSGILGVSVAEYFVFAIFNWLSPIMTLLFAALNIKIRRVINNT